MIFRQVKVGQMENFAYLIADEGTGEAAVVDPGAEPETLLELAEELGVDVKWVVATHSHSDHVLGNDAVVEATGAQVVAYEHGPLEPDVGLGDGDTFHVGGVELKALHTPGHIPDHLCFVVDDDKLLTGDTLFIGDCGRVDLPGGSAEELYDSLFEKVVKLPDHLEVCPGHDYGPEPTRTLGEEKEHNFVLEPRTKEEFVAFMAEP